MTRMEQGGMDDSSDGGFTSSLCMYVFEREREKEEKEERGR